MLPKDPTKIAAYRQQKSAQAKARADQNPELIKEMGRKGGVAKAAMMTPEERKAFMLDVAAAREIKQGEARRRGESLEKLSPAKRSEISALGGRATAARRTQAEAEHVAEVLAAGPGREVANERMRAFGSLNRPIKLPSSGRRSDPNRFCKLLKRVCRERSAQGGWAFEGQVRKSGSLVARAELWPSKEYPATPIVLECAGRVEGMRGAVVWILWRLVGGRWQELGRAKSTDAGWVEQLGPAAEQALLPAPAPTGQRRYTVDVEKQAAWIDAFILKRMQAIADRFTRSAVLARAHDLLSARLAAEMSDVEVSIEAR